MLDIVPTGTAIAPMSPEAIDKVRQLETMALALPQVPIRTEHVLHAGMYARTIVIPAGVMLTGALIKIPTLLIAQGEAVAYIGADEPMRLGGYTVIAAAAGRKQAFLALTDLRLTMIFPTAAESVQDAEWEFTDEAEALFSRRGENVVIAEGK